MGEQIISIESWFYLPTPQNQNCLSSCTPLYFSCLLCPPSLMASSFCHRGDGGGRDIFAIIAIVCIITLFSSPSWFLMLSLLGQPSSVSSCCCQLLTWMHPPLLIVDVINGAMSCHRLHSCCCRHTMLWCLRVVADLFVIPIILYHLVWKCKLIVNKKY